MVSLRREILLGIAPNDDDNSRCYPVQQQRHWYVVQGTATGNTTSEVGAEKEKIYLLDTRDVKVVT